MQDNNIKVAIIDNGLNQGLFHELTTRQIKAYQIKDGLCVLEEGDTSLYGINHGTVCAALLTEFASDAELLSISLKERGDLPVANLETALIWCMNHQVNVICMSIGISRLVEIKRLIPLFYVLASKGITIIAAGSNNDIITYPAALPIVIGVRYKEHDEGMSVIKNPLDGIDIEADMPQARILIELEETYNFVPPITNSIVTPYVTSKIIKLIIKENKNYTSLEHLKQAFGVYVNANIKEVKDNFSAVLREDLLMLENIEIPIIGLIYDKDQINAMMELSISLHNILCKNDYNGVLFSTTIDRDIENNVFHIDENKMESDLIKYIGITSSDIILLHLPSSVLYKQRVRFMDLIIQCEGSKFVYWEEEKLNYICENTEKYNISAQYIFNIIEETFR